MGVDSVFVFGRTWDVYTRRMVSAIRDYFDKPDLVLYLFGSSDEASESFYRRLDVAELIYDHRLEDDRSSTVDVEYLRSVERERGQPNLWRCLMADRKLVKKGVLGLYHRDESPFSHAELLTHLEVRTRALEDVFREYDFDFAYGQQIMRLGGMLTYTFAQSTSTPFFRAGPTRVKDRMVLLNSVYERCPELNTAFDAARDRPEHFPMDEARDYMRAVRDGGPLYWYRTPDIPEYGVSGGRARDGLGAFLPDRVVGPAVSLYRFLTDPGRLTTTDYYYDTPRLQSLLYRQLKWVRNWYQRSTDTFDDFDSDASYVYFPLQAQPELSLMIWAPYHTDLPSVVKNVAQSLPVGTELYVNEHPEMTGVRPSKFYDQLRRLPHVRVLSRDVDTNDVIRNADAVVTITASVGLQALIHGVPVATLGRPNYARIEGARNVPGYDALPRTFEHMTRGDVDEESVTAYIAACLEHGIVRDDSDFPVRVCEHIERAISDRPDE